MGSGCGKPAGWKILPQLNCQEPIERPGARGEPTEYAHAVERLVTPHDLSLAAVARRPEYRRAAAGFALALVVLTGLIWVLLTLAWPQRPVRVHVRWQTSVTDLERVALERRFRLTNPVHREGTTWEYQLTEPTTGNIRALVQHQAVDDTAHLNRVRYRPELAQDRTRQIAMYSAAAGAIGAFLLLVMAAAAPPRGSFQVLMPAELRRAVRSFVATSSEPLQTPPPPQPDSAGETVSRGTGITAPVVAVFAVLIAAALTTFAGASVLSATAALVVVFAGGYAVGSLFLPHADGVALAVIRTVAGLLLTTMSFLLSLVLTLPWFAGPALLIAAVAIARRRAAFSLQVMVPRFRWDGAVAALLALTMLSPVLVSFAFMAPGEFPPVFYNVDTAYSLEKVHALVRAENYPPPSLSNVGVRGTYHYGTQGMAAFVSRTSGLLPHQALFAVVLPLLTCGIAAGAAAAARFVAPAVPLALSVPLLLISTPTLANAFWAELGPQWWEILRSGQLSLDRLLGENARWGFLSNEGQNLGGDFLTLSAIAAIAAAPKLGRILPAFLIGSALIVKTPIGIALMAAFGMREVWSALGARQVWPSSQALMTAGAFAATVVAFFLVSYESRYGVEPFPLYHLTEVARAGRLTGLAFDALWLLLPAIIAATAGSAPPTRGSSTPFLVMALGPILVVNATHLSTGGGGSGGDWLQVLHPVPFLLHAFVLSVASARWNVMGAGRRAAFLLAVAVAVAPVAAAAGRYTTQLLQQPETGHDFVDNRSIAAALSAIPREGTVVVTNDLRYPAQNFSRDFRQMQIPALFGHQAFAANYAYELVEYRRPLQLLLQQEQWSSAITDAARTHGWTHLVIRKDYPYPQPVPLERVFENDFYAVFRFPPP